MSRTAIQLIDLDTEVIHTPSTFGLSLVSSADASAILNLLAADLPTTEPVAIGAWWMDNGKLTKSSGIPPAFATQPADQSVLEGEDISLSVAANNAATYKWEQSPDGATWSEILGEESTSYSIVGATNAAHDGLFIRCVATGPGGVTNSTSAELTVVIPNPLTVGLQFWFDGEQASPNDGLFDSSPNNRILRLLDGQSLTSATGKIGNAPDKTSAEEFRFSTGEFSDGEFGDTSFSLSLWWKPTGTGFGNILQKRTTVATLGTGYYLYWGGSSFIWRIGHTDDSQYVHTTSSGVSIVAGQWYHLLVGFDRATNQTFMYVDNVAQTPQTITGSLTGAADFPFRLNSAGAVDSFAGWNRVLTSQERDDEYNAGSGINGAAAGLTMPQAAVTVNKNIVFDGHSLVAGQGAEKGINDFPTLTLNALGRTWQRSNVGIGGQTMAAIQTNAADVTAAYDATKTRNACVCWGITNSIKASVSAVTVQSQLASYVADRIADSYDDVYVLTCLPRGAGGFNASQEADRLAVNAHLIANQSTYGGTGHVIDVTAIPELQDADDTDYYSDGVHLTPAGYALIANAVAAVV